MLDARVSNLKQKLFFGLAGLAVAGTLLSGFNVVDTGEAGVILRFGRLSSIATEGLNFKIPWIDTMIKMSVREKNMKIQTDVSSRDMQTIRIDLNAIYAVNQEKLGTIYQTYKTNIDDILIRPVLLEVTNGTIAEYDIEEFVSHRAEISDKIEAKFKNRVGEVIIVKDVSLVHHDFSDQYDASIEQKKIAQQNAEKAKYELERVKYEAEAQKVKAQTLTPMILQEKALEKWDGKLPQYFSGEELPFIGNLGKSN